MSAKMTVEDVNKCFEVWTGEESLGVLVYSREELLTAFQAGFNTALEYVNSTIEEKK